MSGVRAFFGGLGFVVARPGVWPLAWVPALTSVLLFAASATLGLWAVGHIPVSDGWAAVGSWALRIVTGAVAIVLAAIVAMSLAQPLSGWALDRIVRRQENELGLPPHPPQPGMEQLVRSLGVALLGLAVGLPILALLAAITFFFPAASIVCIPLKLVVLALLAAWDLLDYPFSQRGMGIGARLSWMRSRFGSVFAFGMCAAIVLLVPGIGLFVLPVGVAGAARLVTGEARTLPR
jgi:CysZ protein